MIEQIASKIDPRLSGVNGKFFYSGRKAFSGTGGLYILGFNPGGDPDTHGAETVGAHTQFVLSDAPAEWSAYMDEIWQGNGPNFQLRMQHLFDGLNLDLRRLASGNLILTRSKRITDLGLEKRDLIEMCWPIHAAVLTLLKPRAVICLGGDTASHVRRRVGANQCVATFTESYDDRSWQSSSWRSPAGLIVIQLTHPSVADWTSPEADPTDMVRRILVF